MSCFTARLASCMWRGAFKQEAPSPLADVKSRVKVNSKLPLKASNSWLSIFQLVVLSYS